MKVVLFSLFVLASTSSFAATYSCAGTEPFWSLSIAKGNVRMSAPDINEGNGYQSYKILSSRVPVGTTELGAVVIKTKYTTATIAAGQCNDGMSEKEYTHTIVFDRGDMLLTGCCNVAE